MANERPQNVRCLFTVEYSQHRVKVWNAADIAFLLRVAQVARESTARQRREHLEACAEYAVADWHAWTANFRFCRVGNCFAQFVQKRLKRVFLRALCAVVSTPIL